MQTKAFYTEIRTAQIEKTLAFYVGALGFHVEHIVTDVRGTVRILENSSGARIELIEDRQDTAGLAGMRTNVASLEEAIEELKANECAIEGDVQETPAGREIIVIDPNGIRIRVVEHIRK